MVAERTELYMPIDLVRDRDAPAEPAVDVIDSYDGRCVGREERKAVCVGKVSQRQPAKRSHGRRYSSLSDKPARVQ